MSTFHITAKPTAIELNRIEGNYNSNKRMNNEIIITSREINPKYKIYAHHTGAQIYEIGYPDQAPTYLDYFRLFFGLVTRGERAGKNVSVCCVAGRDLSPALVGVYKYARGEPIDIKAEGNELIRDYVEILVDSIRNEKKLPAVPKSKLNMQEMLGKLLTEERAKVMKRAPTIAKPAHPHPRGRILPPAAKPRNSLWALFGKMRARR